MSYDTDLWKAELNLRKSSSTLAEQISKNTIKQNHLTSSQTAINDVAISKQDCACTLKQDHITLFQAIGIPVISGVLTSLVATCIFNKLSKCFEKRKNNRRFFPIQGKYKGFKVVGRNVENIQKSNVTIKHITGTNHLDIMLTHDLAEPEQRVWDGLIVMDNENFGRLTFFYKNEPGEYGTKSLIYDSKKKEIYIIHESPVEFVDGKPVYGKEVLKNWEQFEE